MTARMKSEIKIFGINFLIVSVSFTVILIALSVIAGELLDFYPVSYEVIFPFLLQSSQVNGGKQKQTAILISLPHKAHPFFSGCCSVI